MSPPPLLLCLPLGILLAATIHAKPLAVDLTKDISGLSDDVVLGGPVETTITGLTIEPFKDGSSANSKPPAPIGNTPPVSVRENPPSTFKVGFRSNPAPRTFPEHYAYMSVLICASAHGLNPFNDVDSDVDCTSSFYAGIKMTGRRPPAPTLQVKSVLWTLRSIVGAWEQTIKTAGRVDYKEVGFVVWENRDNRLAVGEVVYTREPPTPIPPPIPQDDNNHAVDPQKPFTVESDPTSIPRPAGAGAGTDIEPVKVDVSVSIPSVNITSPHAFYSTLLDAMVWLAELPSTTPIGNGIARSHPTEHFLFAIGPTSEEEAKGEGSVMQAGQALDAMVQLADTMGTTVPEKLRFHAFEASVTVAGTGVVLGRIVMAAPPKVGAIGEAVQKREIGV